MGPFGLILPPAPPQVLGLGETPPEVVFQGAKGVYCEEGDYDIDVGALDTFWRGAENFETRANFLWTDTVGMLWAVSQASPLRRVVVAENLKLFEYRGGGAAGYASGGFLADAQVKGHVASGSQQQWLTRNTEVGGWLEGVWNMVFVGVPGAPPAHCGQSLPYCQAPYVVVEESPLVAGKPFISASPETGRYRLHIPGPERGSRGPPVAANGTWRPSARVVDFEAVHVADNRTATAASLNARLAAGLHVVLAPGVYRLEAPLVLVHPGQVLLGLGLATLIPTQGTPAVVVREAARGARVAGLLLQAGTKRSPALLQWGEPGARGASSNRTRVAEGDYGFLHDVFARVGGPREESGQEATAESMVQIHANGRGGRGWGLGKGVAPPLITNSAVGFPSRGDWRQPVALAGRPRGRRRPGEEWQQPVRSRSHRQRG